MTFIRKATHGGEWYPTDDKLKSMLEASFHFTDPKPEQKIGLKGIISPHSCYQVCLRTAAHGYAVIDPEKYNKIILLGTCHNQALATVLVSQASEVETPLGSIKVDTETCSQLASQNGDNFSFMSQEVDEAEHSLEMQYPLIKYVFGERDISIIPLLVGSLNENREAEISTVLSPLIMEEKTLFIISSDFTHWGEIFHFTQLGSAKKKQLSQQLEIFDERATNIICGFNYDHFRFHIDEICGSICGCYAICLILHILHDIGEFQVYKRSELCTLQTYRDFSISYIAAGFYDKTQRVKPEQPNDPNQEEEENIEQGQNLNSYEM